MREGGECRGGWRSELREGGRHLYDRRCGEGREETGGEGGCGILVLGRCLITAFLLVLCAEGPGHGSPRCL